MQSVLGKLNLRDILRSLVVAFLVTFGGLLLPMIEAGQLPTWPDLVATLKFSAVATIAYLLKNWLTNSQDKMLAKESPSVSQQANANE